MTHGGRREGAGRKPRPEAKRVNIMLNSTAWEWLKANGNVSHQIEKLVEDKMDEQKLLQIAEAIYSEISGADNKAEHATSVNEIYEWLYNGDTPNAYTLEDVPAMVQEWREYNGL